MFSLAAFELVSIVGLNLFWGKVSAVDTNIGIDSFQQQNERHFKLYSTGNYTSVIVIF
jgi:hypothetical protein